MAVTIKRVYESPAKSDGARVLVDRLWPRGLRKEKEDVAIDQWLRHLAPSTELRQWFHAQPGRWLLFRKRYLKELSQPQSLNDLQKLYTLSRKRKRVTLLYSSKNELHNNAVVLKDLLNGMRKPPTGPGAVRASRSRVAVMRRG